MKKIILVIILLFLLIPYFKEYYSVLKQNIITHNFNEKMINNNIGLGYIIIDSLNINRIIKEGIDKTTLDSFYVGHVSNSSELDSKYGNIILAGHNINSVFKKLHYINKNDKIKIITKKGISIYKVCKKEEILISDKSYFIRYKNKKNLTLITCTKNVNKRLIILAEKV